MPHLNTTRSFNLILSTFLLIGSAVSQSEEQGAEPDYLQRGKAAALNVKAQLGANLTRAIQQSGTAGAVTFCHEGAQSILENAMTDPGIVVKRVSDKPRNPANQANEQELAYIESAKLELAEGKQPTPTLDYQSAHVTGYYPIVTNGLCLQCHGDSATDISEETHSKIMSLYPADRAQGYGVNELRGIWVVDMDRTAASMDQSIESTEE